MNRTGVQDASPENHGSSFPSPAMAADQGAANSASRREGDRGMAATSLAMRLARKGSRISMLAGAVLLLAASGAQAQSVFGAQPVGASSGEQNVTVTAQVAGAVAKVEVLTLGVSGLDFAPGIGALTCGSATLAVNGTCTESVTFTPAAPGLRIGAVVLLDSNSNVLGTAYLSGTGSGGLGVFVPGAIQTVAGDGQWVMVLDGNLATTADLELPSSVALDGAGNLYIADSVHNRIRMVCASAASATIHGAACSGAGIITTIAGNGDPTYTGDGGPAANATVNSPSGVALDGAGNLYIADTGNNVVRKITAATGIIATVAGNGTAGSAGDAQAAILAELNQPWGVTLDISGNLYIADTANHRIRRVMASTGVITTVAGNGFMNGDGTGGYAGDNGKATLAELNRPFAVAFDALSNMYIPDSANNRVRMVNPAGVITTFAGTGTGGHTGDGGPANAADLWSPSGLAFDPAGNLYIADTQNNCIRKVSSANQYITSIGGNGAGEYGGDNGSATAASMYGPYGISLDGSGNLFIADYFNQRIREIQSNLAILNFTATPIRQGSTSAAQDQTVENDGNAALDLTAITPDQNAAVNDASIANPCTAGIPFLAVNADCAIGAVFAPSSALVFPPTVTSEQLTANIEIGKPGDTVNSPLGIELIGVATAVNSTTITVVSSLNPSGFGQSVTFTAAVTTGANTGNLTGTVTFFDGATTLAASVALNSSGAATYTTTTLAVGLHAVTASYNGDTGHFSSKSTDNAMPRLIQTVLEATTTTLTSSQNPSAAGQNVIFTATVTTSVGGGVAPDGFVTFTAGAQTVAIVPLSAAGVATYQTANLTNGLHTITAVYGGDAANDILGSTSPPLKQDVLVSSAIVLTSGLNPSNYGSPVTFTVTVNSNGTAAPTGTVSFLDAGQQIGTANLVGITGAATFTISSLAVGSHSITAAYKGDTDYAPGASNAVLQVVSQALTSTAVVAAPNPEIAGGAVAITATVTITVGMAAPSGTVTFSDGTVTLGAVKLSAAGTATVNPVLAPGIHTIVATYSGDADSSGSASAPYPLTVQIATTQTAATATPNPSVVESPVTFTARVTGNGGMPGGSVGFLVDGASIGAANLDATGTATINYSALAAGAHSIVAVYAGDGNDQGDTSPAISLVVGTIPTFTNLGASATTGTAPALVLVGTVVDTTGSGPTPTGTITFQYGSTIFGSSPLDSSGIATLTPSLPAGTYTIVAAYGGDALHSPSTSQPVTVSTTAAGFNLTVTPSSVTMVTGQNATVAVALTSASGFADTIGLGCASLPAGVTCHFSNYNVALAANALQTAQLIIDTNYPLTGGTSARNSLSGPHGVNLAGWFLPFGAFFGWAFWRFRKRHAAVWSMVLLLLLSGASLLATGCSGITSSSAAPGTYVIQVTGTGVNSDLIHYQNVTLNITK